jgi:hypothetical protein
MIHGRGWQFDEAHGAGENAELSLPRALPPIRELLIFRYRPSYFGLRFSINACIPSF